LNSDFFVVRSVIWPSNKSEHRGLFCNYQIAYTYGNPITFEECLTEENKCNGQTKFLLILIAVMIFYYVSKVSDVRVRMTRASTLKTEEGNSWLNMS